MTDKLLDIVTPLNEAILALAEKNAALEQRVERLEQELAGEIARANRAIAAYNALASQEEDLDKLTAQQKPNEQAMEEA